MAKITLIAALDLQRGIGQQGELAWRLPADLAHFKRLTMGKPLIMGRKTCASIGRSLPGRVSVVLSHDRTLHLPDGCQLAHTQAEAVERASQACTSLGCDEIMVIGGAQIYALFLPVAQRLELSWVQTQVKADVFFPELPERDWNETERRIRPADKKNPFAIHFVSYRRT